MAIAASILGLGKGFKLVIGHWSLVISHWSLVIGHWELSYSSFSLRLSLPASPRPHDPVILTKRTCQFSPLP
ncbi:hypothetical protein H6G56_23860 [Anabaena variabilis FACHB-164]|nr:hypothetical protein [Trichormus variabilis FACHB-164]